MGYKKTAAALALAFMCAAMPTDYAHAARDTEPYSCKINGRTYDPAEASITIDAQTGEILSGDNIDEVRYPASMTKMMSALLIFEALEQGRLSLNDPVRVWISPAVAATRGNSRSTWLNNGERLTVREAILAITVSSANNVSVIMAEKLAGSETAFVARMNRKAQELGMTKTDFRNATGLPDRRQVSTARDMAKLALHIYRNYPQYYHFFSAPTAEFGPWRGNRAKHNHNELAMRNRDIDGLKTGFICDSGYNLAASAVSGQDRVISIVFGGRTPHQRNVLSERLMRNALNLLDKRDHNTRLATSQGRLGHVNDNVQSNKSTPSVANGFLKEVAAKPGGHKPV